MSAVVFAARTNVSADRTSDNTLHCDFLRMHCSSSCVVLFRHILRLSISLLRSRVPLATLGQELVYGTEHDETMKAAMRAGKTPEDILDMGTIQPAMQRATDEFEKYKKKHGLADTAEPESSVLPGAATAATDAAVSDEARQIRSAKAKFLEQLEGNATAEHDQILASAELAAKRLIDANVCLAETPTSEKKAKEIFEGSAAFKVAGVESEKYIAIILDPGQMGETITCPHLRIPPLSQDDLKLILRAFIAARDPPDGMSLASCDLYFAFDNGHPHNMQKILQCFVNNHNETIPKFQHKVLLTYDEDSLPARKSVCRTAVLFDQLEDMRIVSGKEFSNMGMPVLRHLHFSGSNYGNKLGDIVSPNFGLLWQETCAVKHEIHGARRQAVGGKTQGEEEGPGRGAKRKTAETVEPVFWHARPQKFWEELINSYKIAAVIDFSASDGVLALVSAKARIPYLGICLTKANQVRVRTQLIMQVMKAWGQKAIQCMTPSLRTSRRSGPRLKPAPQPVARAQRLARAQRPRWLSQLALRTEWSRSPRCPRAAASRRPRLELSLLCRSTHMFRTWRPVHALSFFISSWKM